MQQPTSQREDITSYSDAELSLRCYNEVALYSIMRASGHNHNAVLRAVNDRFVYTGAQLTNLFQTIKEDLEEKARYEAEQKEAVQSKPKWLF